VTQEFILLNPQGLRWGVGSVANLAFFPQHWVCFDAHLRDFFVSCGLRIFGLVLNTLAGFWAYVMFSFAFLKLLA